MEETFIPDERIFLVPEEKLSELRESEKFIPNGNTIGLVGTFYGIKVYVPIRAVPDD